jgi:demethylmenaquinone methyltransferase/2-methoxy-6-polyprenyl-1,4-benzoquinol methylase
MPDPAAVNSMFGRISRRYDIANLLLSGGIDSYWRRRLVSAVKRWGPRHVLDLATGSGDVAFELSRKLTGQSVITGMDFCQPMLDRAEAKKRGARHGLYENVSFRQGDVLACLLRMRVST